MERDRTRYGFGFTLETKEAARARANGACEFPPGCEKPNNQHVGHLDSVALLRQWQYPVEIEFNGVKSQTSTDLDATIVQCWEHDKDLDKQQEELLWELRQIQKVG